MFAPLGIAGRHGGAEATQTHSRRCAPTGCTSAHRVNAAVMPKLVPLIWEDCDAAPTTLGLGIAGWHRRPLMTEKDGGSAGTGRCT
jgi:hypothetical protein